jgi:hypothetical protein
MTADAGQEEKISGGDGNGARAVGDVVDLAARYTSIIKALVTRLQGSCKALSRRDL